MDFVLGGGIVPGSLTLVGGEPGIGKSTLLLQCAARIEANGVPTLYATGEESVDQVGLRAARLQEPTDAVHVLPEVRIDAITARAAALGARVVDATDLIEDIRLVKSPIEVVHVRKAAAIADEAMAAARDAIRPGITETELEGVIMGTMMKAGGGYPGIRTMVA